MYEVIEQQIDQWFDARAEDGWDRTSPAMRSTVENQIRHEMLAADTVVPPCPSWCVHDQGHEYDSVDKDDETLVRSHSSVADGASERVGICAGETNRRGLVTVAAPMVNIWTAEGQRITPDEARALAVELNAAADLLDEITASAR